MTPPQPRPQSSETHRIDGTADASTSIVLAVADRTGAAIDELPPLYESIDPDALDRFVDGVRDRHGADGGSVALEFEYAGREISLAGTSFEIRPAACD